MTDIEYAWAAVDIVIDLAAEQGLKYRRGDFAMAYILSRVEPKANCNPVNRSLGGIVVILRFDYERGGKKLRAVKDNFLAYKYCRVTETGVRFTFSFKEIEIQSTQEKETDLSRIDDVIRKVQKLLALADTSRNPSEAEAIAASMQAQRLLAKYNLEITDVTGEEKQEEIEQVIADVGVGKKWKYTLAEIVAGSYCCKCYYHGTEMVVFYGFQSDVIIARRVFVYLFKVGNSLANKYVRQMKEAGEWNTAGIYNSFCKGFCYGVNSELQKNCTALALVVPKKVKDSFEDFSKGFKNINYNIRANDNQAYETGRIEGKRAMNAHYIEKK